MAIIPTPCFDLSIRLATDADIPFMDALHKLHNDSLGWFPTKQFEGYIAMNGILIAESEGERIGYCISKDRYSGRDDLGAIYQLAVTPGRRRSMVAGALVKKVFERAAYGCRLFCCWCAQDLDANYFWESVGFVPIAFRTGSRKKGKRGGPRTHILWQRRVCENDEHPYWYPYETKGGAIREDRLVFPIMPGTHWSDAVPVILPEECQKPAHLIEQEQKLLEDKRTDKREAAKKRRAAKVEKTVVDPRNDPTKMAVLSGGGIKYVNRPTTTTTTSRTTTMIAPALPIQTSPVEKPKPEPRKKHKHEVAALGFCRELRDRWVERVAEEPALLEAKGKYEVAKALPGTESREVRVLSMPEAPRLLAA